MADIIYNYRLGVSVLSICEILEFLLSLAGIGNNTQNATATSAQHRQGRVTPIQAVEGEKVKLSWQQMTMQGQKDKSPVYY